MDSVSARLCSQVVIELVPLDPSLVATFSSNYSQRGLVETDVGEETEGEGLFSDDTGFYSALEDLTSQDEAEDEEERLEREVDRNYPALLEKYCRLKHKAVGMKDPFNEVNFTELCIVLKKSADKSGLMKSAELLDVAIQIFCRQVSVCQRSVVRLAEEVQKRGRRRGPVEENDRNQRTDENGGDDQQEARQRRAPVMRSLGEKRGKWVDEELEEYTFVKEFSEQIVTRRVRMHECMEDIVQNPYLDFEVNLGEFYNEEIEEEVGVEGNQDQVAAQLIKVMGRYASARTMGNLFLPGELFEGNEEDEIMEGLDLMRMMEVENMEPPEALLLLQSEEEDAPTGLSAGDDLGVVEMVMEGEGGENVPPKEKGRKGSKRNRKRRRVPFGEHQNISEEESGQVGDKRARLEGDGDGDGAAGGGEELSDNLSGNGNAVHDQSTLLINEDDFDNWAGSNLDFTGYDDGLFRPPSPLTGQDWSLFNFAASNHRYDMQAIKTKFKEIVESSPPEQGDITFVQILEKCEMSVLARSDHCIFRGHNRQDNHSTAPKEISVGVAFLAMLHNAGSEGFYLKEDPEGAFRVSREMPVEIEGEVD